MHVCFCFYVSHISPLTEMNVDVQSFSIVLGHLCVCVIKTLLLHFHQNCMPYVSSSKSGPNEVFFPPSDLPIRLSVKLCPFTALIFPTLTPFMNTHISNIRVAVITFTDILMYQLNTSFKFPTY